MPYTVALFEMTSFLSLILHIYHLYVNTSSVSFCAVLCLKLLRFYVLFCDFSEHIQGTWVTASKHDSEVENKAGRTDTESNMQRPVTNGHSLEK
jgi:hypothetical protein